MISINDKDISTFHAKLLRGSFERLFEDPEIKPFITNESRMIDGVQVLGSASTKVKERSFSIFFFVDGSNKSEALSRKNALISEFRKGLITIKTTDPQCTFRLYYQGGKSLKALNHKGIVFAADFLEPNPENRL